MDVLIEQIQMPERIRSDLGDLDGLADSLRTCGQLNPVTLSRDLELLAGHRRLEAARRLGWTMIDAHIIDDLTPLRGIEIEIQENLHRKDFSPEELLDGIRRLERLRRPPLRRRAAAFFKALARRLCFWRRFRRHPDDNSPPPPVQAAHA